MRLLILLLISTTLTAQVPGRFGERARQDSIFRIKRDSIIEAEQRRSQAYQRLKRTIEITTGKPCICDSAELMSHYIGDGVWQFGKPAARFWKRNHKKGKQ